MIVFDRDLDGLGSPSYARLLFAARLTGLCESLDFTCINWLKTQYN